jgi:hypothetical protein
LSELIVGVEKNTISVTNSEKKPVVIASFNFEKVTEGTSTEVGIIPIFTIYSLGIDGSEECKERYKEYYKYILHTLSTFPNFNEVYYTNSMEGSKVYCLKDSILAGEEKTKVPHETGLKIVS